MQTILEYLTPILSHLPSISISAIITYFLTIKYQTKLEEQKARSAELENDSKEIKNAEDSCRVIWEVTSKMKKDLLEMDNQYREQMNKLQVNWQQAFDAKCVELTNLQVKVTKLEGVACHRFGCKDRLQNPKEN